MKKDMGKNQSVKLLGNAFLNTKQFFKQGRNIGCYHIAVSMFLKKSPNFIRTKDRHRITCVLASQNGNQI